MYVLLRALTKDDFPVFGKPQIRMLYGLSGSCEYVYNDGSKLLDMHWTDTYTVYWNVIIIIKIQTNWSEVCAFVFSIFDSF